jgi:hypothetical protein
MPQAGFATFGRTSKILALAIILAPLIAGAASHERIFEGPPRTVKSIRISGFRGQLNFIPLKDGKTSIDARVQNDDALQPPWKPVVETAADGSVTVTISGPPTKADWKVAQIPPINLEIRGVPVPVVIVWKEGEVLMKDWKAPTTITHHKGRTFVEGGRDLIKLYTLEGEATVTGHQGRIEVDNYNAKINLSGIEGSQRLENFSGHLVVEKSKGDVHLRASRGKTDIRDTKGSLEFEVAQGEVNLEGLEGPIRGQGDQGQVNAIIRGNADFKVRADATKVSVLVAKSSGAKVDLGTNDGNFAVSFPMKYDRIEKMKLMKGQLSGKDGGIIFVRTKTGDVRLRPIK